MTKGTLAAAVLIGWLCISCMARPAISEVTLQDLFQIATSRDSARLLRLEPAIAASPDPTLSVGLPIALYVADPTRFAQRFVESFPTSYGELMYGLYPIELASVLPEHGFIIRTLGQLAQSGNATATRKILLALPHSDGFVSEALFEELTELLLIRPRALLRAFTFLTGTEQAVVVRSLRHGVPNEKTQAIVQSLRSLRDLSGGEKVVADTFLSAVEQSP